MVSVVNTASPGYLSTGVSGVVPIRFLCGPTSSEFQFQETLDPQLVKPSWCLLVKTKYLKMKEFILNSFGSTSCSFQRHKHSLCSGFCKQVGPCVRIKHFCTKQGGKISIFKTRRIVFFHKIHICCVAVMPILPKPFGAKWGHGVHPPVHENTEFRLIVPRRVWPRIQRLPVWFVPAENALKW